MEIGYNQYGEIVKYQTIIRISLLVYGMWIGEKMDLRQIKTKNALCSAFLELRAHKELSKITIKELCELAQVSKATFYLHYRDIYDLSDCLIESTMRAVAEQICHPEWILSAPKKFSNELICALKSQDSMIRILFSGLKESLLPRTLEKEMKKRLYVEWPRLRSDAQWNMLLTFLVMGGYYTYYRYSRMYSEKMVTDSINHMVDILCEDFGLGEKE